jgi:hypothetical protein
MVAGNHDGTNARASCTRDRVSGFESRRIDDANQSGEHKILFNAFVGPGRMLREGLVRQPSAGNAKRPECLVREDVVRLEDGGAPFRRERPPLLADEFSRASHQQDIGGAFGEDHATLLVLGITMQRAHQLAL